MAQQLGSFEKVLRVGEGRRLKRLAEQAKYIGTLEPDFEKLSDADLAAKTVEFRQRVENGEHLDEVLFEAFAAVREAGKRTGPRVRPVAEAVATMALAQAAHDEGRGLEARDAYQGALELWRDLEAEEEGPARARSTKCCSR